MGIISKLDTAASAALRFLLQVFSLTVRPLLGGKTCRFYPTCTSYAMQALKKHGALKGGWLTVKRLLRCHPFCEGGVDLVP